MGFFDFLKRKEEIVEEEKVKPDNLGAWLQSRQKSNEEKEKALLDQIKQKIAYLTKDIGHEIDALKNIDWEKKKAEERIVLIVKENLNNYIILLSKLNENLNSLDEKSCYAFIGKLNFIFADFERRSFMSLQKATFLIGKEFEDVKESIKNFFRELKEILESNKNLIETSKIISFLASEYSQTENIEKTNSGIHERIGQIEHKRAGLENKADSIEKDIKRITESGEYSEKVRRNEEIKQKQNALRQDILELKNFIDLKSLAKAFHESEKKMKVIKEYSNDFYNAFENDRCRSLMDFIANAKKKQIDEMLAGIQEKKQEIEASKEEKDETVHLRAEIERIKDEIEALNKEKSDSMKRIQRSEEKKQEILESIKKKLAEIKVRVE